MWLALTLKALLGEVLRAQGSETGDGVRGSGLRELQRLLGERKQPAVKSQLGQVVHGVLRHWDTLHYPLDRCLGVEFKTESKLHLPLLK